MILKQVLEHWLINVFSKVYKAVIYLDDNIAECLHWCQGLNKLINEGAKNICQLKKDQKCPGNTHKAVFITSLPLFDEVLSIIEAIVKASTFDHCIIITSVSPAVHNQLLENADEDMDNFSLVRTQIMGWMAPLQGNRVEVIHVPLFISMITPNFALFSPYSFLSPLATPKQVGDKDYQAFKSEMKILAGWLNSLFAELHVKEDIFTMGMLSHALGAELENFGPAKVRRRNSQSKISLIIVDRSLDLAGPSWYGGLSLFDQILNNLPPLTAHSSDVAIDMTPILECKSFQVKGGATYPAPGCLSCKHDQTSSNLLAAIVEKKQKETLLLLNKRLAEAQIQEKLIVEEESHAYKISPEVLMKRVLSFKGHVNAILRHQGLLQLALGVLQSLNSPQHSRLELLKSIEQLLLQNLANGLPRPSSPPPSSPRHSACILNSLLQLVASRKRRDLSLDSILNILVFLYSLPGEPILDLSDRETLQEKLAAALAEDGTGLPDYLLEHVNDPYDASEWEVLLEHFLKRLEKLSEERQNMVNYRSLIKSPNPSFPATYESILVRILQDILSNKIQDIPDLLCHSGSLTDRLVSGLNLFLNVSKNPRPSDNETILFLVLGGISPSEICLLHQVAAKYLSHKVLFASTRLLSSTKFLQDIFHQMVIET